MSERALQHRFVASRKTAWELAWITSDTPARTEQLAVAEDTPWLTRPGGVVAGVRRGVALLLRYIGLFLFLSPAFVVPTVAVLMWEGSPLAGTAELGGYVVVGFVCAVVVFFALLNVFVLLTVVLHLQGRRRHLRWPLDDDDIFEVLHASLALSGDGPVKRVVGELVSVGAPDDDGVLVRAAASRKHAFAVGEASDAAIRTDTGDVYLLRFEGPFFLFNARERGVTLSVDARKDLARRGKAAEDDEPLTQQLSVGDQVEVHGVIVGATPRSDAFELGGQQRAIAGARTGYRAAGTRPAEILASTSATPLLLRRLHQ